MQPKVKIKNVLRFHGRIFLFLLCAVFFSQHAYSSEKGKRIFSPYSLRANAHWGFVIPHHHEMWALTDGYFPSFDFTIFRQTNGKRAWHYLYSYPVIGLSYCYSNFGGSKYLGKAHTLVPFIIFPIVKSEKIQLGFKAGLGIGYLTRKFHRLENYKNLAIGSHLNAAVSFELLSRFKLSKRMFFNAGLSLMHLSNGTIKTPNYGLNIPAVFGGFTYKVNNVPVQYLKPENIPDNKGKINFRLMLWGAGKQVDQHWDGQFLVLVLTGDFSGFYNNRNRILIGFDMIYDESVKYVLESDSIEINNNKEIINYGINIGHEWVLEKLSLYFAVGMYVHAIDKPERAIYDKIGIYYAITPRLVFGATLKAHYAQADYFSVGVGFNL